jgi:hypothetical protein
MKTRAEAPVAEPLGKSRSTNGYFVEKLGDDRHRAMFEQWIRYRHFRKYGQSAPAHGSSAKPTVIARAKRVTKYSRALMRNDGSSGGDGVFLWPAVSRTGSDEQCVS